MKIVFRLYGEYERMIAVDADYIVEVAQRMNELVEKICSLEKGHIIFDELSHRFKAESIPYSEEWFRENNYDHAFVDDSVQGDPVLAYLSIDGWYGEEFYISLPNGGETAIFNLDELVEEYNERTL